MYCRSKNADSEVLEQIAYTPIAKYKCTCSRTENSGDMFCYIDFWVCKVWPLLKPEDLK